MRHHVELMTDNTTVVAYISKQEGHVFVALLPVGEQVLTLALES